MHACRKCTGSMFIAVPLLLVAGQALTATAQEGAPTNPGTVPTLRASAHRVVVDVVVTDNKNQPVRGLTESDFKIAEDGVPQKVRSFEAVVPAPPTPPAPPVKLPPNTFANIVSAPSSGPITVILYDVLNTPTSAMPYAHDAMVKFIKSRRPGSQIAIFVLGSKLRMLQGFTTDETALLQAINSKRSSTQQSSLLLNADNANVTTNANQSGDAFAGDAPSQANMLANLKDLETSESTFFLQQRLDATVDAFTDIARFLAAFPGRKNLLWLSGSFPSSVLPDSDPAVSGTSNEYLDAYSYSDRTKEATDLLVQSHVAVYPVDVRGLQTAPEFSAASNRTRSAGNFGATLAAEHGTFAASQAAEHGTMDQVAGDTGGRAFYNTNGLQQALDAAMQLGSTYYTISYTPTNPKYDGKLRKIAIALDKPYRLDHRRSYFALDADAPLPAPGRKPARGASLAALNAKEAAAADPQMTALTATMQHGAPVSTQLSVLASVIPQQGPALATLAEVEHMAHYLPAGKKAPASPPQVQHYAVNLAILGRQLQMPPASTGGYESELVIALAALDTDGQELNGTQVQLDHPLTDEQYKRVLGSGYHSTLEIAAPITAHTLKVGVLDLIGNKVGTLEIPLPIASAPAGPTQP